MTDATTIEQTPIIARADIQYRWRVYLFFVVVFGWGLLSIRDGFVRWPAENAKLDQMKANGQKLTSEYHNDAGIIINKAIGIIFPLISLPVFVWLMYRSRGAYRLEGTTLSLPGVEPIKFDQIQSMDKSNWEKKGHAVLEFNGADGKTEHFTLRDMVYNRKPTDQIVERIETFLKGSAAADTQTSTTTITD